MDRPTYGIAGRGRVATHMARYLELESQTFATWHRGMACGPAEALGDARFLLLAISDDALEDFLTSEPELATLNLVHFSGSKTIPGATGMHPLMTFGPKTYDLETYRAIPFITDRGAPAFSDVFPALSNLSWAIGPEEKPLYHAMCVMAGNFPTLLWSKAFEVFERDLGLPRDVLVPYLARTLENSLESGGKALTGPLVRGDVGTVQQNLAALGNDPFANIYRAFAHVAGMQEIGT